MGNKDKTRDSRSLANMMFDELDALRDGKSTPQQARAKAAVANTIISVSRLEMDYARFVAEGRSDETITGPKPIAIGHDA